MTAVAVVTVVVTAVEEGFGRGGVGLQGWMCRVSSDGGCQKIAKAIWRFHPTVGRHVFDPVLKHE